jgi:hypothetical protein
MPIKRIARSTQGHRAGDLIAQLTEKAYFLCVDDMIARVANQEATSRSRNLADVGPTMFVDNTNPPPIAPELQREDHHKVAVVAAAAAVAAPPTVTIEDAVAVAIAEAEATRTAMPLATNVVATMPATGSLRYTVPKRLPTPVTTMVSPPTFFDFALYYSPRSSSRSGSASTTRSKT